jgi:uncharacterized protein DUF1877
MSMTTQVYAPTEEEIRPALQDAGAANRFFSTENRATPMLDLDKSWHGLHYLLSGTAWESEGPLAFLVADGEIIDLDPSSARVFWKNQVEAIDDALSPLTAEELRRRFNPQAMMQAEIYPEIWDRDPKEDDTLGWLVDYFEKLKGFVHEARQQGRCLAVSNEWPAAVTKAHVYTSRPQANRNWKRLAPIAVVAVCGALTATFYSLIPRSNASLFTEIAMVYFIAAVLVMFLAEAIERGTRKWMAKDTWLPNLKTGAGWASAHFLLVFLFVLAGKLFGFL